MTSPLYEDAPVDEKGWVVMETRTKIPQGTIRTTWEAIDHLPSLYRRVALYLVRKGEIEVIDSQISKGCDEECAVTNAYTVKEPS